MYHKDFHLTCNMFYTTLYNSKIQKKRISDFDSIRNKLLTCYCGSALELTFNRS